MIAEALLRIAADRGLVAATMREVAAEAGVSVRLVQYYFTNREQLLIGTLPYLAERLSNRLKARYADLPSPPPPRAVVETTLLAILPTDEESRRITTLYNAFYTVALADPALAARHGAPDVDALEALLAKYLGAARTIGEMAPGLEPAAVAAGLLALTNGLGASVLGGQRTAGSAEGVLRYHLDNFVFTGTVGTVGTVNDHPEPTAR